MDISFLATYKADSLSLFLSTSLLMLYQGFLRHKERRDPSYTVQAVNRIARTAWVENVMREGRDILVFVMYWLDRTPKLLAEDYSR